MFILYFIISLVNSVIPLTFPLCIVIMHKFMASDIVIVKTIAEYCSGVAIINNKYIIPYSSIYGTINTDESEIYLYKVRDKYYTLSDYNIYILWRNDIIYTVLAVIWVLSSIAQFIIGYVVYKLFAPLYIIQLIYALVAASTLAITHIIISLYCTVNDIKVINVRDLRDNDNHCIYTPDNNGTEVIYKTEFFGVAKELNKLCIRVNRVSLISKLSIVCIIALINALLLLSNIIV